MTSPSPADTTSALAQRVSLQFANRPTFEQVAQDMLELTIKEKYPSLTIDLSKTQLATPNVASNDYTLQPFMPRVLEYLALGTPVDFRSRRELHSFLSDTPPRQLSLANGRLDMKVIEELVLELPWTVPIGLEDALIRFWNDDIGTSTHSISRWRWLSDVFKNELHIRGLQQPGLTEPAREALDQIVRWPDRDQRFSRCIPPVYAYSLESTVTQGVSSTLLPSNELLLLHFTSYGLIVLLCSPGSAVQSFESMEAFLDHWRERIASRYIVDSITIRRSEISGNAFDTLAAMMLEQQLADLRTVQLPSRIGLQDLKTLYNGLSDPARYLLDVPRPTPEMSTKLEPLLPEWIKKASVVDQTRFQQYSLALASAKNRSQGRTFLSDITDINTFSTDALLEHMRQANDRSPAKVPSSHYQPDDIELTFSEAVGAFETPGYIEKTKMSLIDLAIKNLVAKPKGQLTLSHRLGLALPEWLTPDFITRKNGLIEQVDIGTTYPRYLQQKLFDDVSQAQKREQLFDDVSQAQNREQLFAEQIPAQLLLDALKLMLNSENGMTRQGLDLVEALLKPDADSQQVNRRPVVIQHLAFLRKPEAQPDIVTNMFIIEPQDVETGPHLLYAPLYAGSLLEFPTRQALLQAIATPGTLQNSVLTWMSDAARPVYANGGFLEPHIVRFLQGDEFSLPEKPAPATLAIDGVNDELLQYLHNGKLMQYLYGSNARALVDQADRNSVSNSESRWALFLEGASLLFNTLLFPLLRGPLMATAWLVNLMLSASQDIPALNSEDPVTRELAAVDLLLNLGMLAIQFPAIRAEVHAPLPEALKEQAMVPPAPRTIPEQWPAPPSPRIVDGPVALPGEYPETSSRILDLSQASAHPDQAPNFITLLRSVRVTRPASLPEPIKNGPLRGLYVIDRKWCALVGEHLYRVSPESDGSVTIVDPLNPARHVLALGSDTQGNWFVDLRLRQRGGMPLSRLEQMRRANSQKKERLLNDLKEYIAKQDENLSAEKAALDEMMTFQQVSTYTERQRAPLRQKYYEVLQNQTKSYLILLDSRGERATLNVKLPPATIRLLMTKMVETARNALVVVGWDRQALIAANSKFLDPLTVYQALADDRQGHLRYITTLSDINEREIYWLKLNDQYLEELKTLDSAGEQVFKDMTEGNRPENVLVPTARQVSTLSLLAIKVIDSDLTDILLSISEPLAEQVRSHSELRTSDLTPLERLEVLESLTEHYEEAVDALRGVKTVYADEIEEPYFDRLFDLVDGLRQEVSQQLTAEEVKSRPEPGEAPSGSETPAKSAKKKVIKTRKNGVLIGDVKPATEDSPIEVVELRSEADNQLLATYALKDGEWDVVPPQPPAAPAPPARPPQTRLVNAIMGDADTLLAKLEDRLSYVENYKKDCRFPQQIEETMSTEMNRYRKISQELERAVTALQSPSTPADLKLTPQMSKAVQTLTKKLSSALSRLTTKVRNLRIQRSQELPPTNANLQYLLEQKVMDIARPGERIALAGPRDFLQEYAIKFASGKRKGRALWYAHFHYETATIPKGFYKVAHLKTEAQRYDGSHSVVKVYRGEIGKHLAQTSFLPLAN